MKARIVLFTFFLCFESFAGDHPGCSKGGGGGGGGGGAGSGGGGGGLDPESARIAACWTANCPTMDSACQAQCVREPSGKNWRQAWNDGVERTWEVGQQRLKEDQAAHPLATPAPNPEIADT